MKKTILILADTNLLIDGRIRRHILALKDEYNLIVTGLSNPNLAENIEFINCSKDPISNEELDIRRRRLRERIAKKRFEDVYWGEAYIKKLYKNLENKHFDIILANDISMVPLGVKLAKEKEIKIIADMHEYAPRQFEDMESWVNLFKEYNYYLCKEYLPKCNLIFTVCKGLAEEYKKEFGVNCEILTNSPMYEEISSTKTKMNNIKMVYHGAANKSRHLENIIEVMKRLDDRFSLDLYLIENNDKRYFKELEKIITVTPKCNLKDTVKPEKIVDMLKEYDIGIFLLEPVNFNYEHALPNKFFEFIQARLAIAIGPSKEMKEYVEKFNCGIVADDFNPDNLAKKLNALTESEIDLYKENSGILAKIENSQKNKEKLLDFLNRL